MAYPGRTTPTLVQGIVDVDSTAWPDITPFIDIANELVTECCTGPLYPDAAIIFPNGPCPVPAGGCGVGGYTSVRLELIERWLSAHFYRIADQAVARDEVGGGGGMVGQSYQYKVGTNLQGTMYGQQALALDTRGGLAFLQKRIEKGRKLFTIGVTYLGENRRQVSCWGDVPAPAPVWPENPCP